MTELQLFQYTGEPNTINKSLGEPLSVTGLLYDKANLMELSLQLESITPQYNYAYLPELKRYYFIDSYTQEQTGLVMAVLKEDVLMTYADAIKQATAHIINSDSGNKYNSNRETVTDVKRTNESYDFPNTVFNDGNIIMITVKGK